MHVKFANNTSKWQIEFNSAFKGLIIHGCICGCLFDIIILVHGYDQDEFRTIYLIFVGPCIIIYSYSTTNKMHLFSFSNYLFL
jgi:hypothetical protein